MRQKKVYFHTQQHIAVFSSSNRAFFGLYFAYAASCKSHIPAVAYQWYLPPGVDIKIAAPNFQ